MQFLPTSANPGFAAGVNRGVGATTGEYVLRLESGLYRQQRSPPAGVMARESSEVAVCGALVREADGSVQASARRFPGVTTGLAGRTTWLTRLWPDNPLTMGNLVRDLPAEPIEVDWVSGACMMIRRDAFAAVGGMDEQFFLYWEDADLCRRLNQAGWKTYYHPGVTVTHLTGAEQPARAQGVARGVSPERLPILPEARESAARAVRISGAAGSGCD